MKLIQALNQRSNANGLQALGRLRINSLGLRLFLVITGGILVGMGGMAFLFGETVKFQAEDQIKSTLRNKVSTINDVTDQAETLAYGLNVSVKTLHLRRAETPETYEELVRRLFEGRPDFVTGLGFGQAEYGVLPSQQWLFPYYYAAPSTTSPGAEPLAAAESETFYSDQAALENFYPKTARYRDYFLPQKNLWTTPYQSDRGTLLTYYSQIFNPQGEWLGTVVIDVDGTHLSEVLNEPILRDGGNLMLLSTAGDVVANPANLDELETQTYQDIPGLGEIWPQMGPDAPGFIEGATGYWAYTQMPERDWVLVAYIPYRIVFGQVMVITLGATTVVGLLLAGLVALVIRYLNRRMKAALVACQDLSELDEAMLAKLENKDEIDQLSASFFYLLGKYQQQPSSVDLAAHQRQMLEESLAADGGLRLSHFVAQVQQWGKTTDDLSQTVAKQALAIDAAGHEGRDALKIGQEKMALVTAELEALRKGTHQLVEQMQNLLQAADHSTQLAENHGHILKVAQAVISGGLSSLTRLSNRPDPGEIEDKVALFQRLTTRLQELTDDLSQAALEQGNNKQQMNAIEGHLNKYISIVDRHQQELVNHAEVSHGALDRSRITVNQMADAAEQMTDSSQQLEELAQRIQQTIRDVAIAETSQV